MDVLTIKYIDMWYIIGNINLFKIGAMRTKLICLSTIFAAMVFNVNGQSLPEIGKVWTGSLSQNEKLYVPNYGIINKVEFINNKKTFIGGLKDNKLVFISTKDSTFEVSKVRYVNKLFSFFQNGDKVKCFSGWGHYLPLENGWYAGFDYKSLKDSSKVLFLFKM